MSLGSIGRDVPTLGLEGEVELGRVDVKVAFEGVIVAWGLATITTTTTTASVAACIAARVALAAAYAANAGGAVTDAISVVRRWAAKRRRFQYAPVGRDTLETAETTRRLLSGSGAGRTDVVSALMM